MLYRYGAFVARRAKVLLVLSLLLMAGAAVLGAGAFGKLRNGGFDDPAAPSTQAQQLIADTFGGQTNLVLLATPATGSVDDPGAHADGVALTDALSAEPYVSDVVSYFTTNAPGLRSEGGTDALILGHISGDDSQMTERADAIVERFAGQRGSLTVRIGGQAGINHDVTAQVTRSLTIAESIAVPLTLLLLLLAFGSLVSALLPLAVGGVAILGTFAELDLLGSVTDVSIFAINLTTALGLGLGIDYALFLVSRFREQLAAGDSVPEAVARTVATAGRTVVFTAVAVMAALAALLVFPLYFLRSFGYAGIGVVAIAALGALVLLPALLAILGHRVNAGRVRLSRATQGAASPFWGRLAGSVMRRPALLALPVLALLLTAGSPLLGVVYGTPDEGVLHSSTPGRQVSDALATRFPGNSAAPIDVVATGALDGADVAAFARTLSLLPDVAQVSSSAGTYRHGSADGATPADAALGRPDAQRFTVVTTPPAKSDRGQDLVRTIRGLPAGPDGASVLVGGVDAALIDTKHAVASRLPLAVALVLLTTLLVLFLFTGSVVQPVRAVLLNALSLGATLGILTWVFQDGHLAGLLGVTPRPMDMSMTVLLFCIAFGLSMDYEVFVLSRIKEMHDRGLPSAQAVPEGLARSGRIVSTAAGLLAVSFFAFGTSTVSFLQMFGIGAGLAILIDATLVRGVLVPAAMRALGRTAWYAPALLRRVHTRVALEEV
ncbi:MAG TPA: MMPL family transporter [Micromonosporaceae bacterium]|jgi:RND superfamily putative drug exporter